MANFINQLNLKFFLYINNFSGQNTLADNIFILSAKYLPYFYILILIIFWFRREYLKNLSLLAFYTAILTMLENYLIGIFFFSPRPFTLGLGKQLIYHKPDSSFPSDHTSFMLAIAIALMYHSKTKFLGFLLFVLGVIGGVSRIYCGVHYPLDILGSIFTAFWGATFIFFFEKYFKALNYYIISFLRKFNL